SPVGFVLTAHWALRGVGWLFRRGRAGFACSPAGSRRRNVPWQLANGCISPGPQLDRPEWEVPSDLLSHRAQGGGVGPIVSQRPRKTQAQQGKLSVPPKDKPRKKRKG